MFVSAIEEVQKFTRPIYIITRNHNEVIVNPGTATLFFVNELGCAITCKHVIELLAQREDINRIYSEFVTEKKKLGKSKFTKQYKALEAKYGLTKEMIVQLKELFIGVTNEIEFKFKCITHPTLDLAIIIFEDLKNPAYESYAKFLRDSSILKQGKSLCRLGYPFPEFTNFEYIEDEDSIRFNENGIILTPSFPIDGILTRHLISDDKIVGIELSTPGLKGQSGGPLFDTEGRICGMQASTHHLHLGFDMKNFEYQFGGRTIKVTNQPFLHVGHCVHVDIIKEFLTENNIKFYED